jgi:hypothetical protein
MVQGALPQVLAALLAVTPTPSRGEEPAGPADPRTLLARAFHNVYGHDFVQTLRLESRFPGGRSSTRRLQIARKQTTPPGRALIRFLEPGDIRRTSVLILERVDGYDDLYLFLPAFARVRRLTVHQRADSFFGTDIVYEDLEPKRVEDFEVEALGPGSAEGLPCVRLRTRPRVRRESTYDHVDSCVEDERAVILWSDFYRQGERIKRLEVDPASIERVGAVWIPHRARFRSEGARTETELVIDRHEPRSDLADSLFTAANLEFGDALSDLAP